MHEIAVILGFICGQIFAGVFIVSYKLGRIADALEKEKP